MGAPPKALAKISTPRSAGISPRERLFSILSDVQTRPLLWIQGPAGSGKTSLLTSYCDVMELSALWYQMDSGDNDPASFFYYLGLSAKRGQVKKKNPYPLLRPEYLAGLNSFARQFFRELFGRQPSGWLVIDKYQECVADSALHPALAEALSEIPDGWHVAILSRDEPPAAYARLRSSSQMYVLDPNELRLTLDECEAVCKAKLGDAAQPCTPPQLQRALELTQGWVTGLVLMLDPRHTLGVPENVNFENSQVIFDYFAGQIYEQIDPRLRDIMLKAALLPFIIPSLLETITGYPRVAKAMTDRMRHNQFVMQHEEIKGAFIFQPLFKEFLSERARQTLGQYEIIEFQQQAADALAQLGYFEQAAELYCQLQNWHSLAKLVQEHASALVNTGRHKTLRGWLDAIPEPTLTTDPWLQYWLGVGTQPFNLHISRKYLIQAYEQFKKEDQLEGLLNAWLGVVESYILEWGNFKPLDRWIDEMETLLQLNPTFPSDTLELRVTAGMFAALMYRRPEHPRLLIAEKKLYDAVIHVKQNPQLAKLGYQLFFYYTAWLGDLPKASVLADLLRPGARHVPDAANDTLWYALDALFLWKKGEPEASLDTVKKALAIAEQADFHLWDCLLYSSGVYATLSLKDEDQAQRYLKKISDSLNPNRLWDLAHYHYLIGRLYLFQGKIHESYEHSEAGLKAAIASGAPYAEALSRTILAQALFRLKQPEKAVAVNNLARDLARRIGSRNMLFFTLMSEAEFSFAGGGESRAVRALEEAFTIAREQDLIKHAFWWPPIMAPLCVKALEHNVETEFVQRVVRERQMVPDEAPAHLDNWPWHVKVSTLNQFSITVEGKLVDATGKARKRPLELLKVLIALGGRQIEQSRVHELLWPDAEGDTAMQALHTTLHRLRKLIGEHTITLQNGYINIDPRFTWVDVWSLERLFKLLNPLLRLVPSAVNSQKVSELSEKIFALYQGEFLESEAEHSWVRPYRQKLSARFKQILTELGTFWQRASEWDRAIVCYQQGLTLDPLAEELYQQLIQAFQKADRPTDAAATFQLCRKNLSDGLGTSPSPKTVALYKSIRPEMV